MSDGLRCPHCGEPLLEEEELLEAAVDEDLEDLEDDMEEPPEVPDAPDEFAVVVECSSTEEVGRVLADLTAQGYDCRAVRG